MFICLLFFLAGWLPSALDVHYKKGHKKFVNTFNRDIINAQFYDDFKMVEKAAKSHSKQVTVGVV
jgi:hypothetical protein